MSYGGGYNFKSMLNCDIPNKIDIWSHGPNNVSVERWVFGHYRQRQNVMVYPAKGEAACFFHNKICDYIHPHEVMYINWPIFWLFSPYSRNIGTSSSSSSFCWILKFTLCGIITSAYKFKWFIPCFRLNIIKVYLVSDIILCT